MRNLAALVRQLSDRVIDLSTLGVQNRVHAELLRLVRGSRHRRQPGAAGSRSRPASQISTNREQVTRELNALRRDGVLAKDGKALVVADVQRLVSLVAEVGFA